MATLRVLEVQNEWMLNDSVFLALLHGGGGNKGLLLESNKRGGVQPSWVVLHSMAHIFIELDKAVVYVIRLLSLL